MPDFPLLATGARVQFPFERRTRFMTETSGGETGPAYAYYNEANGLKSWVLTYTDLPDAEAQTIEDFFHTMRGAWDEFDFTDPTDNVKYTKCHFAEGMLARKRTGPDMNSIRLVIEQTN